MTTCSITSVYPDLQDGVSPISTVNPRTAPRPTDQRSGELKDPALSAFLGLSNDEADIDFTPVPPDPAPGTCPHCERPVPYEDTTLTTPLAHEHGLPPHLCLNCTLEELELLSPYTEADDRMPVIFAVLLAA